MNSQVVPCTMDIENKSDIIVFLYLLLIEYGGQDA